MRAAVEAIRERHLEKMRWDYVMAYLSQLTITEEDAEAKRALAEALSDSLFGEGPGEVSKNLDLLEQAGGYPVRIVNAGA